MLQSFTTKWWRWLPAIAWMIVIFWFSSQPNLPRPQNDTLNFILRKTAHFCTFALLALTYVYALGDIRRWRTALVLTIVYAISDEIHQGFTPNRYPTWTDVVIDTAGGVGGLIVAARLQRVMSKIKRVPARSS